MSDTIVSFIRTYVPLAVGALLTWLAKTLGVELDTQAVTGAAVAVVTAIYYALARLLESRWPKFGWLLGSPKAPTYTTPG